MISAFLILVTGVIIAVLGACFEMLKRRHLRVHRYQQKIEYLKTHTVPVICEPPDTNHILQGDYGIRITKDGRVICGTLIVGNATIDCLGKLIAGTMMLANGNTINENGQII